MAVRAAVYLAGPEVFLPDAQSVLAAKVALCEGYGLEGLSPFDADIDPAGLEPAEVARRIFRHNRAAMDRAGVCVANLTPFRGVSADVGTVFEVGYMLAAGRLVFGYSHDRRAYGERVAAARESDPLVAVHAHGWASEEFGLGENLMVPLGIEAGGGAFLAGEAAGDPFRDLVLFERCLALVATR